MAEVPANTPRTLTEHEAYAIAADRVTRETAELTTQVAALTKEKAELSSKLDVAEASVATEKDARAKAEKDLGDFKAETDKDREVASRKDARTAKVKEIAVHLGDDFYTAERVTRWAQMDDAAFEAYTAELAAALTKTPADSGAPRQTAMTGTAVVTAPAVTGNGTRLFELSRGGGH